MIEKGPAGIDVVVCDCCATAPVVMAKVVSGNRLVITVGKHGKPHTVMLSLDKALQPV